MKKIRALSVTALSVSNDKTTNQHLTETGLNQRLHCLSTAGAQQQDGYTACSLQGPCACAGRELLLTGPPCVPEMQPAGQGRRARAASCSLADPGQRRATCPSRQTHTSSGPAPHQMGARAQGLPHTQPAPRGRPWLRDTSPRAGGAPEGGEPRVGQGARWPRARGGCADEPARAGIVDPDFRTRRGLGVHGCWVEQGGGEQALPVREGRRAIFPTEEKEGCEGGWNPRDPGNPSRWDGTLQGARGSWSGLRLCRGLGHKAALSHCLSGCLQPCL